MLLQGKSGSEIICSGAKPAPWSHPRRRTLMAHQRLPQQRPLLFLTILFQREGDCCMGHVEFTPQFMCTFCHSRCISLSIFSRSPPSPAVGRTNNSFFFSSHRLRHHQESAFAPQPVHGELPARGDRAVPAQEEAAHPQPADPAQPQRALRGCEGPGHQDPAQEMQLPQEPRVSE